jgi:hypothetical protein
MGLVDGNPPSDAGGNPEGADELGRDERHAHVDELAKHFETHISVGSPVGQHDLGSGL